MTSTDSAATTDAKPVVMVIEPEVLMRLAIAEYLRDCGYKVIEGVVAEDFWAISEAAIAVDVLFAEVQLRGESDGFALARRVRQTHPQIDVILTSGVTAAAERSKDLCEEGPMNKPYHAADVAARIHLLLERKRSAQKKS